MFNFLNFCRDLAFILHIHLVLDCKQLNQLQIYRINEACKSDLGYKQDLGMLGNRKIVQVGSRSSLIKMCYLLLFQYLNLHAKNNVLTPYIFAIKSQDSKSQQIMSSLPSNWRKDNLVFSASIWWQWSLDSQHNLLHESSS